MRPDDQQHETLTLANASAALGAASTIALLLNSIEAARARMIGSRDDALWAAWQIGRELNEMKTLLGHGHWSTWADANVALSERTRRLYMQVHRENPKSATVADLSADSLRKFMIADVPEKERPEHEGGEVQLPRPIGGIPSVLRLVNEWSKFSHRWKEGLIQADRAEVRRETRPLLLDLCEIHGVPRPS